jgi:Carbohydrate binding domain/Tetratricopeptide repeat
LAAVVLCFFLIVISLRFGISRAAGRVGVSNSAIAMAHEAVRLTPSDPAAHRSKAIVFRELRMYQNAKDELEIAVSLRPRDDYLWLELGELRDELNDQVGALSAFDQAVASAPYYAHTRWQRANLRLRLGRYDEAFPELRDAAKSNRRYLPTLIDLAWSLSKHDTKLTEQLAGINSVEARTSFARLLARQGRGTESLEQYALIKGNVSSEIKRELIDSLIATFNYTEAFEIWSDSDGRVAKTAQIYDGGFEGRLNFGEAGFGWHVVRQPQIEVSQDAGDKESGEKSLRIAFTGDSPPTVASVSQILVVKPEHKYRVNFAVRSEELVSGGAPVLLIEDARSRTRIASANLQLESGIWHKLNVEFTAPANTFAVLMKVARNECQTAPCPIFGKLWLDSFGLEEIGH